jgi:deoxyribose-phosphate aldolase
LRKKTWKIALCTVIGFPLGADLAQSKVFQTKQVIFRGADEIDTVINIGKLLSGDLKYVLGEIKSIKDACGNKILKVIIETAYLTDELKIMACTLAKQAKADFVKTSTGFAPTGANIKDVELIRRTVGNEMGVKASGGVKDYETAAAMIEAGANRIGTSHGVEIVERQKVI